MFTFNELLKASGGRSVRGAAGAGIGGIATDSRTLKAADAFVAIRGERFDGHSFVAGAFKAGASAAVIEESRLSEVAGSLGRAGTRFPLIAVKDTITAFGAIARYHRLRFDVPVVAVTGSNGKTTTKDLAAWLLAARYNVLKSEGNNNNHIGLPLTLLKLRKAHQAAVVELGSNHPGEIAYLADIARPGAAVITNIGPAHLEFFRDLAGVMKEKWALAQRLQAPGIVFLNADDELLGPKLRERAAAAFTVGFSLKGDSDFRAAMVKDLGGSYTFAINGVRGFSLKTRGAANVYNALAAVAVARVLGIDYRCIRSRCASFAFPADRLALNEQGGVTFINDAYNANPASLKQALDALAAFKAAGRKILVMGDMLELGARRRQYHREAAGDILRSCDVVIAVGGLSRFAAEAVKRLGFDRANVFTCASAAQAREILFRQVAVMKDDVVLLKGSRAMKLEQLARPGG